MIFQDHREQPIKRQNTATPTFLLLSVVKEKTQEALGGIINQWITC